MIPNQLDLEICRTITFGIDAYDCSAPAGNIIDFVYATTVKRACSLESERTCKTRQIYLITFGGIEIINNITIATASTGISIGKVDE